MEIEDLTMQGKDIGNYELIQPDPDEITVNIFKADPPKLHIEPYVSSIDEKEIKETTPEVIIENSNKQEDTETTDTQEENTETSSYTLYKCKEKTELKIIPLIQGNIIKEIERKRKFK